MCVLFRSEVRRREDFRRRLPQSSLVSSEGSVRGRVTTLPLDGETTIRLPFESRRGAEGHGVPVSSSEPWPSARRARREQRTLPITGREKCSGCRQALTALEQNCRPDQLETIKIARDRGRQLHLHREQGLLRLH